MFLKLKICGDNADFSSYIFGKNPSRHFIDNERVILDNVTLSEGEVDFTKVDLSLFKEGAIKLLQKDRVLNKDLVVINENENSKYFVKGNELIRKKITGDLENHFLYKKYTPNEVEVLLFTLVNSLSFSKEFQGYVNEKEYLVTSVFQGVINDVFRSALTKEGEGYDNIYDLTYELGAIKPKLSEENLRLLFTSLGFEVDIEYVNEPISFKARRQDVIFLKLRKTGTIRETLRQIYILISAMDNFKHFKPKAEDANKFKNYTQGWIEEHPLRKMITDRYLTYSTYSKEIISEMENKKKDQVKEEKECDLEERGYGENGMNLNTLRLHKMKEAILRCNPTKVLDFGCGEGNLLELLSDEKFDVIGVDSSEKAINRAYMRMKKKGKLTEDKKMKVMQGSLYYKDSRLKDIDTVVLCEVIEHIELERVPQVIDNIMFINPKNFILSTPNKDFNKFFKGLNSELRYYDHRFEFTEEEFNEFCKEIGDKYGYEYTIECFGREIEGIRPTVMATFIKEDK